MGRLTTLINAEVVKAVRLPVVHEAVENGGGETIGSTPEQFAALTARHTQRYAKLLQMSGTRAD
jgi:hypothetical protein